MKNWPMRVVGAELPFFILMTLLIDYRAIYWFVKYPTGWLDDWHQYPLLRFLSISSVYSFILTCIVYYTKKELLKYLFYFVIVLLLCVDVFLFICAHTMISPNSLLFLSETNLREINDFIHTYLFSLSGVFSLLLFAGILILCGFSVFTLKLLLIILLMWTTGAVSSHLIMQMEINSGSSADGRKEK